MTDAFDELKRTVADTLSASGVLQKIKAELRVGVFQALDESGQIPDKFYDGVRSLKAHNKGGLCLLVVRDLLLHAGLKFTEEVFNVETAMENEEQPTASTLAAEIGFSSFNRRNDAPLILQLLTSSHDTGVTRPDTTATAADAAAAAGSVSATARTKPLTASTLKLASRSFNRHDTDNTNSVSHADARELLLSFFPSATGSDITAAATQADTALGTSTSAKLTYDEFLAIFIELSRTFEPHTNATDIASTTAAKPTATAMDTAAGGLSRGADTAQSKKTGDLFSKYFDDDARDTSARDTTAKGRRSGSGRRAASDLFASSPPASPPSSKSTPPPPPHAATTTAASTVGGLKSSPPSTAEERTTSPPARTGRRRAGGGGGGNDTSLTSGLKKDKPSSLLGDLPGFGFGAKPKTPEEKKKKTAGLSGLDDLFGSLDTTPPSKRNGSSGSGGGDTRAGDEGGAKHEQEQQEEEEGTDLARLLRGKPHHTQRRTSGGDDSKPLAATARAETKNKNKKSSDAHARGGGFGSLTSEDDDDSLAEEVDEEELSVGSHSSQRSAGSISHRSNRSDRSNRSVRSHGSRGGRRRASDSSAGGGGGGGGGGSDGEESAGKSDGSLHPSEDARRLQEINERLAQLEGKRRVGPIADAGSDGRRGSGGGDGGDDDFAALRDDGGDEDDGEKTPVPDADNEYDYEQDFEEPSDVSEEIVTDDISEHFSDLSISHGPDSHEPRSDVSAVTEDFSVDSNVSASNLLFYKKA
ncbi:hypothetical protein PTSG_04962 [Salpingoeca rosetta]|uniref:FGFR1 oncogene partner n=1 Tax=Salpingoeca rosetta (strain ATCC 50818 / BSB-021) TaxID=946362 RepID=F2U944_SALR5|nr:uncharacterized protein PTSG_04962 [Salpingoeca rosetta]EGD73247.1 hypothetical protein PTSG_04962 [Salpingoeca rosetta]|eukprot:XP_004994278.1 hypothetical protein PTSG_04962 [Salpingoeca rosetta]